MNEELAQFIVDLKNVGTKDLIDLIRMGKIHLLRATDSGVIKNLTIVGTMMEDELAMRKMLNPIKL